MQLIILAAGKSKRFGRPKQLEEIYENKTIIDWIVYIGGKQMSMLDNMMAYSEIYEILNLMEDEDKERVPQEVRDFFEEQRMKEYKPKIRTDIPLTEQNLKRETVVLLTILVINYWCDSEEEKQSFIDELEKNEKIKKELQEKYNPDNLFKNRKKTKEDVVMEQVENVEMIQYKENLFTKLKKWFEKMFNKKWKVESVIAKYIKIWNT